MCTKFAYDAYKEREKNMANTVKVSREVKQHEGKKFMTAKGIAEMSGIAHGALTNRLYRMKQEHPDHVHYFADEIPAYYDEFAFRYIVKDIKKHPVYRINNQQKYEKFKQLYGEQKNQTTKRIHMGSLFFKIWHIVYEKTTKKRGEKK